MAQPGGIRRVGGVAGHDLGHHNGTVDEHIGESLMVFGGIGKAGGIFRAALPGGSVDAGVGDIIIQIGDIHGIHRGAMGIEQHERGARAGKGEGGVILIACGIMHGIIAEHQDCLAGAKHGLREHEAVGIVNALCHHITVQVDGLIGGVDQFEPVCSLAGRGIPCGVVGGHNFVYADHVNAVYLGDGGVLVGGLIGEVEALGIEGLPDECGDYHHKTYCCNKDYITAAGGLLYRLFMRRFFAGGCFACGLLSHGHTSLFTFVLLYNTSYIQTACDIQITKIRQNYAIQLSVAAY